MLQGKLLEHGLPHFLVLQAFAWICHAGVYRFKDATQQAVEHHRCLVIERFRLFHIASEYFVAEGAEVLDIDVILIDAELI